MDLPFSPASAGTARRALTSWLTELGYDDGLVEDARLVISELVANSVRHASPLDRGGLAVGWQRTESRLVLTVRDGGGATEPTRLPVSADAVGGRGLAIVDALGSWSVEREGGSSSIRASLALP